MEGPENGSSKSLSRLNCGVRLTENDVRSSLQATKHGSLQPRGQSSCGPFSLCRSIVMVGAALALRKHAVTGRLIISARANGEPLATQSPTARFDVCLRSYSYQLENTSRTLGPCSEANRWLPTGQRMTQTCLKTCKGCQEIARWRMHVVPWSLVQNAISWNTEV